MSDKRDPVRFDDALSVFVGAVAKILGNDALDDNVFLRDAQGQITFVMRREYSLTLRSKLKDELIRSAWPYAPSMPIGTPTDLYDEALGSADLDLFTRVEGTNKLIRLVERQIVGADWMRRVAPVSKAPPRLVFASLKGGVGRSTALAVLAADLVRKGKRVLVVDLDIEAPGIGSMLLPRSDRPENDLLPEFGVVDYLVENGFETIRDEDLVDFVGVSNLVSEGALGVMHVIPAVGRATDKHPENFIAKLSRALVDDVDEAGAKSLLDQIRAMLNRFVDRENYDVVLLDARAGLAEVTAAPLIGLGAWTLFFGVDQPQTFIGYRYLLSHLMEVTRPGDGTLDDWRARIMFVQSKAPSAASKRESFNDKLYELVRDTLYDEEVFDENDELTEETFTFGPGDNGIGIPHDASHIQFHPDYLEFDPGADLTKLDPEVYATPFDAFLKKAEEVLQVASAQDDE